MYIAIALILWFIVGLALGLSGKLDNTRWSDYVERIRRTRPRLADVMDYLEILLFCGPIGLIITGLIDLYAAWKFR